MLFVTVIGVMMLASANNAYQIVSGDTYCALAQRFGCPSWEALASNNQWGQYVLQVDGLLNIPSSCTGSPSCASTNYGDTWSSLAARYNMDVNCLMDFNCNATSVPSSICFPRNCGPYTSGTGSSATGGYIIKSGDTYCALAQRFGCPSWEALASDNKWGQYNLPIGGALNVSSSCTGTSNCVSTNYGDTWTTLAARYNMDINCLMDFNCNATSIPSSICLPRNCGPYTSGSSTGTGTGTTSKNYYNVKSGDTYCSIAQKLGCSSWETLYNTNQINPGSLQINTNLIVPPTCTGNQTCQTVTVQPGDTYDSIASRYNVNTSCLMDYNCNWTLSSSLCVPNNCAPYYNPNLNGWVGTTFYCNGVPTSPVPSFTTCGGLMYTNGQLTNGIVGSTFVCQGKALYNPPPSGLINCAGLMYNGGILANGNINGQFYCAGVATNVAANTYISCGNYLYYNNNLFCGFYNGQFYCNGQLSTTGTGVCCGTYYQYFGAKHPCNIAYNPQTQSCSAFLSWYQTNVNPASTATTQDIIDCNPNMWLTSTTCNIAQGNVYV